VKTIRAVGRPPKNASKTEVSTSEQLLCAAEEVFAERGFVGASFRALRARTGLSNAAVLHYFPSKKKLYGAVLARVEESFSRGLAQVGSGADLADRLRRVIDYQLAWGKEHPTYVMIMVRELVENRDRIQTTRNMAMRDSLTVIQRAYRELSAAGQLGGIDPSLMQFVFTGAIIYFQIALPTISRLLDCPDHADLERGFAETVHAVLERCITDGD